VQGVSWSQWAASNDAAPRSEMTCAANDSGEWRRYTSDFELNFHLFQKINQCPLRHLLEQEIRNIKIKQSSSNIK
jgi:hypothetical protein